MTAFVKTYRSFFNSSYWKQERTFSYAEACLDLMQMARFEATTETKFLANGREISIKQGEIHASLRYLGNRWGWGVAKVKRFIDNAKKRGEVKHRTEQGESILILCKCGIYEGVENTDRHTDRYTDQTPTDTNIKKEKKDKNIVRNSSVEGEKPFSPPPTAENPNAENSDLENPTTSETEKRKKVPPKKEKRFYFKKAMLDYGFEEDLVTDWLVIRSSKKAVNSKRAYNTFIREVEKTGKDPNEVLEIVIEKQWKGFEALWLQRLENEKNNNNGSKNSRTNSKVTDEELLRQVRQGLERGIAENSI